MNKLKSNKYERLWVSNEFKRKFKAEAAAKGFSSGFDYSQSLAQSKTDIKDLFVENDRKLKRGFKFDL